MSNTSRNDAIAASVADAFPAFSQIYLTSVEHLFALNVNTVREAIEDCTAATKTLADAKADDEFKNLTTVFIQPMCQKALSYSRSTYEILAKTHEELAKVFVGQLSAPQMAFTVPAGLTGMFDLFAKGAQQITASANENFAAVSDATSKAAAAATIHAKKAA